MNYVELTEYEVGVCQELTERRERWCRENNARNFKVDSASDYDISEVGLTGEYVIMKALGVGGFDAINLYSTNKEGDVLLPSGEWIEVKTTRRPRLNFLVEAQDVSFNATYGALVWTMPKPRLYAVAGWCTKAEFDTGKWWEENMPKPAWLLSWRSLHSCRNWPLFSSESEVTN